MQSVQTQVWKHVAIAVDLEPAGAGLSAGALRAVSRACGSPTTT